VVAAINYTLNQIKRMERVQISTAEIWRGGAHLLGRDQAPEGQEARPPPPTN
jgi:hypothetical protein